MTIGGARERIGGNIIKITKYSPRMFDESVRRLYNVLRIKT